MATGVYQFKGTIMDNTTTKEFMAGVQENIRPAKQDLSRTKGKGDKAKAHLAWASDSAYEKHCVYLCLHLCWCVALHSGSCHPVDKVIDRRLQGHGLIPSGRLAPCQYPDVAVPFKVDSPVLIHVCIARVYALSGAVLA